MVGWTTEEGVSAVAGGGGYGKWRRRSDEAGANHARVTCDDSVAASPPLVVGCFVLPASDAARLSDVCDGMICTEASRRLSLMVGGSRVVYVGVICRFGFFA